MGFHNIPERVWNFSIGGYQVCEKWLKDRKGRNLSKDDITHYQRIVVALSETIRLMKEVDEVIEQHGGWPRAFQIGEVISGEVVPFRVVAQPKAEDRYVTCVPLVPLKVAAGQFGGPQHVVDDEWEWATVNTNHRLRQGMFVAQVVGRSMEPQISDGAWCLFAHPAPGTPEGKTVLVQLRDAADPDTGERYTVKRYQSEKVEVDGTLRNARITLKPLNPDFEPIILTDDDEGVLRVVAEFLEVLITPTEALPKRAEEEGTTPARPASKPTNRDSGGQRSLLGATGEELLPREPENWTTPNSPDRDEMVCVIRQLFTTGGSRDRETGIQELKEALGYQRLGTRIRETLDNALRTAVRRGVVANDGDTISIQTRSIEDYDRDFLKDQFLASLEGRSWKERDDAIRDFARWLGFRRTGPTIDETARSLINGLIREGRLESQASAIRRTA
jgi:SOS-response transcriptional repressor LexA